MRGRQPKPHYRATAEGVRCYEQWLIAHVAEERRRSRLFALPARRARPLRALAVIERYEQACLEEASRTPIARSRRRLHRDDPCQSRPQLVARGGPPGDGIAAGVDRVRPA